MGLFVNINNTVYVVEKSLNRTQVWLEGNPNPVRSISGVSTLSRTVFVTISGNIYVDNGKSSGRVDMWTPYSDNSTIAMYVDGTCFGLFVDIYDSVYCSVGANHKVLKKSVNDLANSSIMIAGNGMNGSAPNMLYNPRGIFVDTQLNLYVADCGNDRIQLFGPGQSNGVTLIGNGSTATIMPNCPNAVVLDADGHLFFTDYYNHRIIGWASNGYQCIAACNGSASSAADHLNGPSTLYFDSYGNIFVSDTNNNRVQKFLIVNSTLGKFSSYTEPDLTPSHLRCLENTSIFFMFRGDNHQLARFNFGTNHHPVQSRFFNLEFSL